MTLDYSEIGRRIAARRKELGLRQAQVCEKADINDKYLSSIERAWSIPSLEVLMKLAAALDTTPDAFLVGTAQYGDTQWKSVAEQLRPLTAAQLELVSSFIGWVANQNIESR